MFRVTQIEIVNIRSIAKMTVTVDPDGITAIVGPSGAGKSTILDAMAWCLYGTTPSGSDQKDLRRDTDTTSSSLPSEVTVYATIGSTRIEAYRKLSRPTSKGTATVTAALKIDGVKQKNLTGATGLTGKITELTGLTAQQFTGAFYIPQRQLPNLAEGRPSEVRKEFEDQTGLARLNRRIDVAHDQAREAATAAAALPGDPHELAQADADAKEARTEADAKEQQARQTREQADDSKKRWETAQAKADELLAAQRAATSSRERLVAAEATLASAQQARSDAADTLRSHDIDPDTTNLETIRARVQHQATSAADREQQITDAGQRLASANSQLRTTETELTEADQVRNTHDTDALRRALDQARATARDADEAVSRTREHLAGLQADDKRLAKAVGTLQEADSGAQCPTCQQHVGDTHTVVADLNAQRDELAMSIKQAGSAITRAQQDKQQADAAVTTAHTAVTDAEQAIAARDNAAKRHDAAGDAAREAATKLAALLDDSGSDDSERGEYETLLDSGRSMIATLRQQQQYTSTLTSILSDYATAASRHEQARADRDTAAAAVTYAPDEHAVATAREDANQLRSRFDSDTATASEADGLAKAARLGADQYTNTAEEARARLDRKQAAQIAADDARGAKQLLIALRNDLLREYTDAISDAATDVMDHIGGKYTRFHVDAQFVPQVHMFDGTTRNTRVLSGGEKARAALSFRLGIADQIIAGGSPGMIFADEITSDQDPETRKTLLGLLRDLGIPLVIISHTEEVESIATQVIRLDTPDGVTTEAVPSELDQVLAGRS